MRHARSDYDRIQDPLDIIPVEEPVFLIRGQDRIAWLTVIVWAALNLVGGGEPKASRLAWRQAWKMRAWPFHKAADLRSES
jgi:hypothetical protein